MKDNRKIRNRIWEIDFFRGCALILMILFHLLYDLKEVFNISINFNLTLYSLIGRSSAIIFIFISGLSSTFSKSNAKRGYKILLIAIIITIITHALDPDFGIKFGILHFLGVCMLLYPLLSKIRKSILIVLGIIIFLLNFFIKNISIETDLFFPIGINTSAFTSSDYYPLIPWLSLFILGIVFGQILYKKKESIFKHNFKPNIINKIGGKTLIIYLLHQPIIFAILTLIYGNIL